MEKQERLQYLKFIREYELQQIINLLPTVGSILEVGAGAGWQALLLKKHGYEVAAVDIPSSRYLQNKIFPVIPYDGFRLPFSDNAFDVIFSSNVLEHIPNLNTFESEIWRVLKPKGIAVHILPTTTWRFWTFLGHYLWVCRRLLEEFQKINLNKPALSSNIPSINNRWRYLFWPNRHGALGNSLSELYLFSYCSWMNHFKLHGWRVFQKKETGIFYTGNQIFYDKISLTTRKKLARFLGNSSRIYVLKKPTITLIQP